MNKCKIFNKCGSCNLLDRTYQETLEIKKRKVNELLQQEKISYNVTKIYGASNPFAYRNKMIITFKMQNKKIVAGFYEEDTHKVIDLDICLLHSTLQNEIAKFIKDLVIKLKLPPYDEDHRMGLIRHVLIRESTATGEVMIVFVVGNEIFPARSVVVKAIRKKFPMVKTIVQNLNTRKTSIVLGEKERILFGKGYIEESLCGLNFKITPKSFFQVNYRQTEVLYNLISDYVDLRKQEVLLDAYSGVGTIGLILSSRVKKVISVEMNKQAVQACISNARENSIKNIEVYCDDATNFMKMIPASKIDVVVMDPPRSGATETFLKGVMALEPRKIIYVSCEPETLIRDLIILKKEYIIKDMCLLDMFCWTSSVESIAFLERC